MATKYLQYSSEEKDDHIDILDDLAHWLGITDEVVVLMKKRDTKAGRMINKLLQEKKINATQKKVKHKITAKFIGYAFSLTPAKK